MRINRRNGHRTREWDTRAGTVELSIPKLRQGSYFPSWLLEPRRRAEQALVAVIADCYLAGVSTRQVDKLVKQLGLDGISTSQVSELAKNLDETVESWRNRPLDAGPYTYVWLDALAMKVGEAGRSSTSRWSTPPNCSPTRPTRSWRSRPSPRPTGARRGPTTRTND